MNKQTKNRTLIIIFSLLLLLNIGMLSYYIFFKDKKPPTSERKRIYISEFLKNDVNFSESQLNQYDSLKKEHQRVTRNLYDSLRQNKQNVFKQIGLAGFSDSSIEAAAQYAATQQKDIELETLRFFSRARNLGTAEQRIKFDSSFYKVFSKSRNKAEDKK